MDSEQTSNETVTDTDCPFCAFIEQPTLRPFDYATEGPYVVSFTPLHPVTPGHRLFIPKTHLTNHFSNGLMLAFQEAATYGQYIRTDFNLITSRGATATQTVDHVHVHFVPRYENDGLKLPWTEQVKYPKAAPCHTDSIWGS